MKTWLTTFKKFRLSNALDARTPRSYEVRSSNWQSDDLRQFAENTAALDQALRSSKPSLPESPQLHAGIMRAIYASEATRAFDWRQLSRRLIAATALSLLILLGAVETSRLSQRVRPAPSAEGASTTFAAAESAFETSGALVRDIPTTALSPLTDEQLRLDRDLAGAQKFLLTCLP